MLIGIDIGTHVARAAALDAAGRPFLIPGPAGSPLMPAVARYGPRGADVGEGAARAMVAGWECSVRGPSRFLARFADLPEGARAAAPFPLLDAGGAVLLDLLYAHVPPEDALALIVAELRRRAEAHLGAPVDEAVIAVPASAEDRYRVLTRAAAEACGLRVRRLINQPSAALLAYSRLPELAPATAPPAETGLARTPRPPAARTLAVVDVGGGTTDVSVAELAGPDLRILATAGDPFLGGHDLAWRVAGGVAGRVRPQAGRDILADAGSRVAALGLLHAVEGALEELALRPAAAVALDHGAGFGRDLFTVVRREQVEDWLAPDLARIAGVCAEALARAGRPPATVDEVLLTGGGSGVPGVRAAVARAFGRLPGDLRRPAPHALAALGAALTGGGAALRDVTPYPLGIGCYFGDVELLSAIVVAGTPIPTPPPGAPGALTQHYTTRFPDQTSVRLDVLQYRGPKRVAGGRGDRVLPAECECLGSWMFDGLRPPPGREAPFAVTFHVDEDGILHLAAEEDGTGHRLAGAVRRM